MIIRLPDGSVLVLAARKQEDAVDPPADSPPHPPASWKGPGHWRSYAEAVQDGEPEDGEDESEDLGLASVRPYERTTRGRAEHVSGYQSRTERQLLNGWIPQPAWKKGQQDWVADWRENEWKPHPVSGLRPGDQAEVTHPVTGRKVRGTVRAVNPDADGSVRLDVEHDQEVLRPYPLEPGKVSKRERREITEDEARGNSRPVSRQEFQHLAALGNRMIDQMKRDSSPPTGLTDHWEDVKDQAWQAVQQPWGGVTVDTHSGDLVADGADRYAMSVKPGSLKSVSVPVDATREQFDAAMDQALDKFGPVLARQGYHLGVFHDADVPRIDIDPVAVVDTPYQVDAIGAYAHSIGGAYHFATGNGYFPPHVDEEAETRPMERSVVTVPAGQQVLALPQPVTVGSVARPPAGADRIAQRLRDAQDQQGPADSADAYAQAERADRDVKGRIDQLLKQLTARQAGIGSPDWNKLVNDLARDGGPNYEVMRRNEVVRNAGKVLDDELQRRVSAALPPGSVYLHQLRETSAKIKALDDQRMELFTQAQVKMRKSSDAVVAKAGFADTGEAQSRLDALSVAVARAQANLPPEALRPYAMKDMTDAQAQAEVKRLLDLMIKADRAGTRATADLTRQMNKLKDERLALQVEHLRLEHLTDTTTRDEAVKLLEEVRGDTFGGTGLTYQGKTRYTEQFSKPKPDDEAAMRWAESNYPQPWLQFARQHAGKLGYSLVGGVERGDYTDSERRIRLSGDSQQKVSGAGKRGRVAVHELGHAMEQSVPGLLALEQAEVIRRTTTGKYGDRQFEDLVNLGYGTQEYTHPDHFPEPYSGKDYTMETAAIQLGREAKVASAYEFFTTGVESLFAGSPYLDDEFRQWLLGTMALIGRDAPAPKQPQRPAAATQPWISKQLRIYADGAVSAQNWDPGVSTLLQNAATAVDVNNFKAAASMVRQAADLTSDKTWAKTYRDMAAQIDTVAHGTPLGEAPPPVPGSSLAKYTLADGGLDPQRLQLWQKIIHDTLAVGGNPQQHPVATFFGGGPASGKSALQPAAEHSVHIDPDLVKAQLPEYQQMTKAGDPTAAAYAHEESSKISKLLIQEAQARHLNFHVDGTGDNSYENLSAMVNTARDRGYQVNARYVTVDTETAVQRAMLRAQKTGRVVPPSYLRQVHRSVSEVFPQALEHKLWDTVELYDNNGPAPRKILEWQVGQQLNIIDQQAWQRFLDKAGRQPNVKPYHPETANLPWDVTGDVVHYHGSLGIPREKTPQFSGVINGRYNPPEEVLPRFTAWLKERGVSLASKRVPSDQLKPIKESGSWTAIRGIADELKSGKRADTKPLVVSSDGYVVDGTQTWSARRLADAEGGRAGLKDGVPVLQASVPASQLLDLAGQFMNEIGMPRRKAGEVADPNYTKPAELNSVNPTGGVFVKYDPQSRATAPLGPNMTTLAETKGVSPDTPLTVYRGAPSTQKAIVPGDFVTDDPRLARDYAGNGKVLSLDTTHGNVLDDKTEPGGGEYIYLPVYTGATEKQARARELGPTGGYTIKRATAGKGTA